jgi:hypothetical protein
MKLFLHKCSTKTKVLNPFQRKKKIWSSDCEIVLSRKGIHMFRRNMLLPFSGWNCLGLGKRSSYVGKLKGKGSGKSGKPSKYQAECLQAFRRQKGLCSSETSANLQESGTIISQKIIVFIVTVVNTPSFTHEHPVNHETYFPSQSTQSYQGSRPFPHRQSLLYKNEGQLKP